MYNPYLRQAENISNGGATRSLNAFIVKDNELFRSRHKVRRNTILRNSLVLSPQICSGVSLLFVCGAVIGADC